MTSQNCPRCGTYNEIPFQMIDVTFIGVSQNILVTCRSCGQDYDATGGGDGTWSTRAGRLVEVVSGARAIREALRQATPEFIDQVRSLPPDASPEQIHSLFRRYEALESWAARYPLLVQVLFFVIGLVLTNLDGSASTPPSDSSCPDVVVTVPSQRELEDALQQAFEARGLLPDQQQHAQAAEEPGQGDTETGAELSTNSKDHEDRVERQRPEEHGPP